LKLQELAEKHPTEGQDLYYHHIRREGVVWNYKRVRRVYLMLGMNRRRKTRKRIPARIKLPLIQPHDFRETWSVDFMSDVLTNNKKFRTLNVIDDFNRQAIAVEVAHSMPAITVSRLMEWIIREQGKPKRIRTDNGPEFVSKEFVIGVQLEISFCSIYNRVIPCKTATSNALTVHSGKIY
jgi:putative transposase